MVRVMKIGQLILELIEQLLSFADFIVCNLPLKRAFEALNFCTALLQMFLAYTTVDPFAP